MSRQTRPAALVFIIAILFVGVLSAILWRTPPQLTEAVGLFDDVRNRPATSFLIPTSSYYRPLYHMLLSAAWNHAGSLGASLAVIKLTQIVPLVILVLAFAWHVRPRTWAEAAAAAAGLSVLLGSAGLVDNLEIPLSYTIVGMPAALLAWMLLEREYSRGRAAAIIGLLVLAVGFKEHGLLIAPLIVCAWWMGAPGASRRLAVVTVVMTMAYIVFRVVEHDPSLPRFEQDIGFGFGFLSPPEAESRFGHFPFGIYGYNSMATIGSLLVAEPTSGIFRFTRDLLQGRLQPWQIAYVFSSTVTTVLIVWWGITTLARDRWTWTAESRAFVAAVVAVAACGAMSFAYSRDRLGGMAVPFYALATYLAVRHAIDRLSRARGLVVVMAAVVMLAGASAWQLRALYAVQWTRQRAMNAQREWLIDVGPRRVDYRERPTYVDIMDRLTPEGTRPQPRPDGRFPRWMITLMGEY